MRKTRARDALFATGDPRAGPGMNRPPGSSPIYLDYQATTPTDSRVAQVALRYMVQDFGNASSVDHVFGDAAERAVESAQQEVADLLGARPSDVVFTSGATESINLAIQGFVAAQRDRKPPVRIGLTPIEHPAVLQTCEALCDRGVAALTYFRVDRHARLDLDDVEAQCRGGLDLVCVMGANNEVGTIYPLKDIARLAHRHGAMFFTDATQVVGKGEISFAEWEIDLLAMSAHKIYGPKGTGALLVAPGVSLEPMTYGGAHQLGRRAGTVNVPGVAALGEACRLRGQEMEEDETRIGQQRDRLAALLRDRFPEMSVNGDPTCRLAGNLHVAFPGVPNQAVVARLRFQLAVSTGSACSSGIEAPSHVLRAMGLPKHVLDGSLRLSLGKFTTDAEVEQAAHLLVAAVEDVISVELSQGGQAREGTLTLGSSEAPGVLANESSLPR